jgi:PHD/YefM family antitoxin component YafN of YafNO toxin-antitoxin module
LIVGRTAFFVIDLFQNRPFISAVARFSARKCTKLKIGTAAWRPAGGAESAKLVPLEGPLHTVMKPVTEIKRYATEVMAELRETRVPAAITEHGEIGAYLVDPETFEAMSRRLELLEGIALGELDVAEGRTLAHAEAKQRMAKWFA